MSKYKMARVLVISDTQAPFVHRDALKFLEHLKQTYKPTHVVHIGDLFDLHALGQWDHDPDGFGAGHEVKEALKWTKELYKLFPKAYLLTSNHDVRAYNKAFKAGIPKAFLRDYNEWMHLPKCWQVVDHLELDNVVYIHGHQVQSGGGNVQQNAIKKYMQSVVFGHFHTQFGIDYYANSNSLLFGMAVGSLIDHKTYAFRYQAAERRKPIIGTGLVIDGIPRLEPMLLTKSGRWKK